MQLFQHTHQILRDCVSSVEADIASSDPDEVMAAESSLTLQPADGIKDSADQVRIKIRRARGKAAPDWQKVSADVEEFCGSVLSFAFNPLENGEPRYEEGKEVVTVEEGTAANSISIVGPARELTGRPLAEAEGQITHMERLMFGNWAQNGHPTIVEKTFASEEESSRVAHLLMTMAGAFGIDEKVTERAFHEPEDDKTIRVDKRFLQTLIRREQTLEASIERD